eukprot:Skav214015  [mRNA]  locus=scaffold1070:406751:410433:- [translate_table: standard]
MLTPEYCLSDGGGTVLPPSAWQEMVSAMDILRRLLGEPGADLIQRRPSWCGSMAEPVNRISELHRRALQRLLLLFDAWAVQGRQRLARKGHAEAMRMRCGLQGPREVVRGWFRHRRKLMAAKQIFLAMDRGPRNIAVSTGSRDIRGLGAIEWPRSHGPVANVLPRMRGRC